MGTPTAHIICPSNFGTLDIERLWNKAEWKKKEIFVFFYQILQIFIIKYAYISKRRFSKKTLSFLYNFSTTSKDKNHISKFLFLT